MKLGFNLLLWTTHVTEQHLPLLDFIKSTGYDGVEVPVFEGTPEHFHWLSGKLADAGLLATTAGAMPAGASPISADAAQRNAGLAHLNWMADCTAALGGELMVGPFHQVLGEFSGTGPTPEEKQRAVDVLTAAARHAAQQNVGISIEPLNRFECYFLNTARDAAALVAAVNQPNFGYLYDTFHFNIEENDLPAAARNTISAINHVHISENNRGTPGTGHIDFAPVFRALRQSGYDGWLTVEAFGSALPALSAATKIWRPLFDRPEDVVTGGFRLMRDGWDAAA